MVIGNDSEYLVSLIYFQLVLTCLKVVQALQFHDAQQNVLILVYKVIPVQLGLV